MIETFKLRSNYYAFKGDNHKCMPEVEIILLYAFIYLGFYAVSMVFQLFNGDSSRIRIPGLF